MSSPSPLRIVLVDDQTLVRAGFRMVLETQPDLVVVGEAGDGLAALELLDTVEADIVLMDIRMPRLDGVEATRRLAASGRELPRVIVLTTFDLDEYAYAALQYGASGFLLKDAGPADLLAAIRAVAAGDAVVAPSTTRRLIDRFVRPAAGLPAGAQQAAPDRPAAERAATAFPGATRPSVASADATTARGQGHPRLAPLTGRELEVLTAVGRGLTNAEICAELCLAEGTVKTHIGRILAKLALRDRVHMVLVAYETGLVGPTS